MAEKIITTNERAVAERLLQAHAIRLSPKEPFTWSSGWKSPIYCDNRKVLGFPYIRDFIKSELCNVIFEKFPEAGLLAGVATAGIAWGAMAADQLKLPMCMSAANRRSMGSGNKSKDTISPHNPSSSSKTLSRPGKSSLQVVDILRQEGLEVIGLVSIFNYGFDAARQALERSGIPYVSLSDYPTLISLAMENGLVSPHDENILLKWSADPAAWTGQ